MRKPWMVAVTGALLCLLGGCGDGDEERESAEPQMLTVLSFSDWHGQLQPISDRELGDVGGAAALSAWFQQIRTEAPRHLTLTAGDTYGASPPVSSRFGDMPAAEALAAMGVDATTLGNHDFDHGVERLAALVDLAGIDVVAANLTPSSGAGLDAVLPWVIRELDGLRVGIAGLVNDDAASLLTPGALGELQIGEPIAAATQARAEMAAAGAEVFILLCHYGVTTADSGPLVDLATGLMAAGVDYHLILGDHTDMPFATKIGSAWVVENHSKGRDFSRVDLRLNAESHETIEVTQRRIVPVVADVTPDPNVEAIIDRYTAQLGGELDVTLATTSAQLERGGGIERTMETPLGNLVADAVRTHFDVDVAFVNGGGLRAPLPSSYEPQDNALRRPQDGFADGPPYDLVVGDVYELLPFGNTVVVRQLSGATLHAVFEYAYGALPEADGRFLQVAGVRITLDSSAPAGSRIVELALSDGTPIAEDDTTYEVATTAFISGGGDGYDMLTGEQGITRDLLADVVVAALDGAAVEPATDGRITDQNAQ